MSILFSWLLTKFRSLLTPFLLSLSLLHSKSLLRLYLIGGMLALLLIKLVKEAPLLGKTMFYSFTTFLVFSNLVLALR